MRYDLDRDPETARGGLGGPGRCKADTAWGRKLVDPIGATTNPPGFGRGSVNPHPEDDALDATRSATPGRSYPARPDPSRVGG